MNQIIDELEDCAFRVNVTLSKAKPFNDTNSVEYKVNVQLQCKGLNVKN